MTTPPPETQVAQSETLEWIADSIARRGLPFSAFINSVEYKNALHFITKEVLSALRNQIERCAEIAERCHPQPCICQTCLIRAEAGAAIRKLLRPSGKDGNKDAV